MGRSTGVAQVAPQVGRARAERREQLLDLAADLVRERGLEGVRMETLAAAAGINKSIVYRSYPNRGAVLVSLFDREVERLGQRIEQAAQEADGVEDWIARSVSIWFDTIANEGRLLDHMLDTGPRDPDLDARRVDWSRQASRRWADGIAGATGLPIEEAMDTASIILSGLRGAVGRWLDDGRPRTTVERRFVRVALAALADLQHDVSTPSATPAGVPIRKRTR